MNRIHRLSLLLLLPLLALAQFQRNSEITVGELQHHLRYIASDDLEGRRSGSKGADLAAEYIAAEFKHYGLKPVGENGTYFQPFDFVAGVELGKKNALSLLVNKKKRTMTLDSDFRPFGFSSSGTFEGEVVFAGYGISFKEKEYDDYAGIDVKDKVVILLRYHPEPGNQHTEFGLHSTLRYKAAKAKEMGAKAILLVTGPLDAEQDELMRLSYDQSTGNAGIIAVNISQKTADEILAPSGQTQKQVQETIVNSKKPHSKAMKDVRVSVSAEVNEIRKTTRNVVGYLEGSDPQLKNEILAIGAHYDHLGWGGEGSGSLRPDTVAIHNGADDNGSGTVGLLELAQYFSSLRKNELRRSILFLAFSAEEIGLLGSAHYVKNPLLSLESTVTMLNMDMIGRLNERKLIVYGTGTSPGFEELLTRHNSDSAFALRLVKDGFGPSDHASFYGKNIPVFHFFTDLHSDYHRPSDEYDKINYEGMKNVLRYVAKIGLELAKADSRPVYAQVEAPRPMGGGGRSSRSYTGTIPDFGDQVDGMKISGVREGSPAAKAGLQGGDIIIKFGKVEIKTLYDYTFALGEYKPGDEVDVVVKRGEQTLTMKLTIERRN